MRLRSVLIAVMLSATLDSTMQAEDRQADFLSAADKEFLVCLARQTLSWHVKEHIVPSIDPSGLSEGVLRKAPCFVTLDKRGSGLRGCIGMFERDTELCSNVISRAVAAASEDWRFSPVEPGELRDIKLEISVLTEPVKLDFDSPEDLLRKLRPGKDGVLLHTRHGRRTSTFLPQVWEQLPDKEEFLSNLCAKQGAPADAWRKDWRNVRVETYEAVVFGEEEYGRKVVGPRGGAVGEKGAVVVGPAAGRKEPAAGAALKEGNRLEPGTVLTPGSDFSDSGDSGRP